MRITRIPYYNTSQLITGTVFWQSYANLTNLIDPENCKYDDGLVSTHVDIGLDTSIDCIFAIPSGNLYTATDGQTVRCKYRIQGGSFVTFNLYIRFSTSDSFTLIDTWESSSTYPLYHNSTFTIPASPSTVEVRFETIHVGGSPSKRAVGEPVFISWLAKFYQS